MKEGGIVRTDGVVKTEGPTLIQSLQRGLRLMEAVGERGRVHPKDLARATGLALPTTYHLLRTLVHEGYLHRIDDGSYVLGDQLQLVASSGQDGVVAPRVRKILRRAREEWRASVYLAMYDDGEIRITEAVDSTRTPPMDAWVGMDVVAHATALGKCVLAGLPDEARRDYLARHPLEALTARTTVDTDRLERELARPVAVDREECFYGIACLAVPVAGEGKLGAIGLAFPSQRLQRVETTLPPSLVSVASQVSRVFMLTGAS